MNFYRFTLLFSFFVFISNSILSQYVQYPPSKKTAQADTFFGYRIEDPYRWLEEQQSEETKSWVSQQNKVTKDYLDKIPNNFTLREQITRNTEIEYLNPERKGKYYFSLHSKFGGTELVIYYRKDFFKDYWEELFITKDLKVQHGEHINIDQYEVSQNSKYIAYTFDKNGSDWKELKVADLDKQKNLPDHLYDIKFTSIVWRGDGFYYTKYERGNKEEQYKQLAVNAKLYYHKLGTSQDKDSLIFKKSNLSSNSFIPIVSSDQRYLIINDHDPINHTNAYYYFDFANPEQQGLLPLFKKSTKQFSFLGSEKDSLYFITIINTEKKIIVLNPKNPIKWFEKLKALQHLIVRETEYYNERFYQLCYYDQHDVIVVFDKKGSAIKKIDIPIGASCSFKGVNEETNQLLFSYQSYLHPAIYAAMDLNTLKFELLEKVKINYEMDNYEIKKVMYPSDTAMVPMLLVHKKNISLNGTNPLLLRFYGGYGIIHQPAYEAGIISFIENGGIYAFAMIRGGGEKGLYWKKDALLGKRQNSLNDIIKGAEYLINHKYTNSSKIAISGSSHGGFLASAVAMQRPDLFAAVVPVVGESDLLRSELFTVSSFSLDEFGSVKDSAMFHTIKSYSPLHNVKKGTTYPAMLFMTSDYDDRVPPLHSYKMTATLQEAASIKNPVLLRVEKNAGHNGARNYEKYIDEETAFYSFILHTLRVGKFK